MDCILLAAGYATRLYPLTENKPKALLTLGSKTILDWVVEKIEKIEEINNIYIVTNHRFADNFEEWKKTYTGEKNVEVLDDGTTNNDNRLGAIGDMHFVINQKKIDDEITPYHASRLEREAEKYYGNEEDQEKELELSDYDEDVDNNDYDE